MWRYAQRAWRWEGGVLSSGVGIDSVARWAYRSPRVLWAQSKTNASFFHVAPHPSRVSAVEECASHGYLPKQVVYGG